MLTQFRPLYRDVFSPILLSSVPSVVTLEQKDAIRAVLDVACSDSKFAEKAYIAITKILTGGSVTVPVVSSLVPNTVEIGDPSVTLHIHGTGFDSGSVIVFNGFEEPTTLVSATEVTTGINMDVWHASAVVPVGVVSKDGVMSNVMNFTFTDGLSVLSTPNPSTPNPIHPSNVTPNPIVPPHTPYTPIPVPPSHEVKPDLIPPPPSFKSPKEEKK